MSLPIFIHRMISVVRPFVSCCNRSVNSQHFTVFIIGCNLSLLGYMDGFWSINTSLLSFCHYFYLGFFLVCIVLITGIHQLTFNRLFFCQQRFHKVEGLFLKQLRSLFISSRQLLFTVIGFGLKAAR